MPSLVLHSSILQNEVLHSSDGMTLLSLDHLYTFKTALSHYAATRSEPSSHFRLEDAVDELRRYVLSSTAGRRRLLKSTLVQAYDWLGPVNDAALAAVTEMYSRAYGAETDMGVEDDLVELTSRGSATGTSLDVASQGQTADASIITASSTPSPSRTPPSPTLIQDSLVGNCSPRKYESTVNDSATSCATPDVRTPENGPSDALEKQAMDAEADSSRERTPVPTNKTCLTPAASKVSQQIIPQVLPGLPPSPQQTPTPKIASRPSAPSLKLQTSFPTVHRPTPKRKKTPVPSRRQSCNKKLPALPTSIFLSTHAPSSPTDKDIRIELVSPEDSDTESLRTDFEDADLTARSPVKTPGGSLWLGIDDILSGGGYLDRRRSSDMFLQTPAGEKLGPMTPNVYEDISPVTRGEWGFLMVGDSFRTRTAGVSCV
ncbi:hypothetical protein N0V82_001026 [Gnomoniopsis sp. IMI 355080]|nr:hypothetical protein N0V82_001026 [Gnomoniopsis sp. IMI 355080]